MEHQSFPTDGEKLKDIVTGFIITAFMLAASVYLPVAGFFISLLLPMPILFYRLKLGRNNSIIIPLLIIVIMLVFSDKISVDILFFVGLLLTGFILSELMELNLSIEKTIAYTCSIIFIFSIACLFFYSNISGTSVFVMISEYVAKNLEHSMALYETMDISEEHLYIIANAMEKIKYVLAGIVPALIIITILFISWTCLLIAKPILKAKNLFYPDFGELKLWKVPEYLIWAVIACFVLLFWPEKTINLIGLNSIFILMAIFFFGGIAIIAFFFEKKAIPRGVRFFLYSLIFLQQIVLLIVIGLGFFDIWFDFRKLEVHNKKV